MSYLFTPGGGGQSWNGGDFHVAESNTFTVFAWAKLGSTGSAHTVVSKWGPSAFGFQLDVNATGNVRANAAGGENLTGSSSVTTSVWHALGMRKNGTGVNGLTAWLDGAIDATGTSSTSQADTSDDFRIGDDGFVSSQYMDGRIAHVAVWSVALTDTEMANLAAGDNPLTIQPASLVCYYPLTENVSPYPDESGNGAPDLTTTGTGMTFSTDNPTVDPPPTPQGVNDFYDVPRNTMTSILAADGVLANDTGVNTLSAVLDTDVANGTLDLNSDGSFDYTPTTGFTGTDSFTYHPHDTVSLIDGSTVTVTLYVYGRGAWPVAGSGNFTDSGSETLDVDLPTGSSHAGTAGRFLVALVVGKEASQGTGAGITPPAGYTALYMTDRLIDPSLTGRHFWNAYYRFTDSTEPENETWTVEGGITAQGIGVLTVAFAADTVDNGDPLDAFDENDYTDVSALVETMPSVTGPSGVTGDRDFEWSTAYSDGAALTLVVNGDDGVNYLLGGVWADLAGFPYTVDPPLGMQLLTHEYGDGTPQYGLAFAGDALPPSVVASFDFVTVT